MIFEELEEFRRDLKKLSKKYRSLPEDLEVVKKVLSVSPKARPPFSYRLEGVGLDNCVIKVKKIACKSLKGRGVQSGFRLVYAFFKTERRILFIEIFHKKDKSLEDRQRIHRCVQSWIPEMEFP